MVIKKNQRIISVFLVWLMVLSLFVNISSVFGAEESVGVKSPVTDHEGHVTFNAEHDGEELFVVGSMNEWDVADGLSMEEQDGIFKATTHLDLGTYEYKFLAGRSWDDDDFLDPQNPLDEDGNSIVHVPGVIVDDLPTDLEQGTETTLPGHFMNDDGETSDVNPTWTLLKSVDGVELVANNLVITQEIETVETLTLQAEYDGYISQHEISIVGNMNAYTINYYRHDDQATDWQAWIYGEVLNGAAYEFDSKKGDYAQTTQHFIQDEITIITRLGDWEQEGIERTIQIPQGEDEVEVWLVEGNEDVYYSEPEIEESVTPRVHLVYEREQQDYDDWNIWVWNTGAKEDQIDFDDVTDVATADIEVGPNTKRMGFKLRKGQDWDTVDVDIDREINISPDENLTKVFVKEGEAEFKTVPFARAPSYKDGDVTFYYRDALLYEDDAMDTIDSAQIKLDGSTYDMRFEDKNERFTKKIKDLDEGVYEYTYVVKTDDELVEVSDPYNLDEDGESFINVSSTNLDVTAQLSADSINYNESAVLNVGIIDHDDEEIDNDLIENIAVDLSNVGGKSKTIMDTELKALSISINDTVDTGNKTLPITVTDVYGNKHRAEIDLHIKPRVIEDENDFDWDEARIYFMLTDRFADGNNANHDLIGYDPSQPGAYQGGDFKGITKNIDYLEDLGINTIWITPIVENIHHDVSYDEDSSPPYYGYHGYWALNFEKLNPHLGTLAEFHELIDAADERGIKLMVDVVLNHSGYGLKREDEDISHPPEGFPSSENRERFDEMLRHDGGDAGDEVTGELSGLPDFITENADVRDQLVQWQTNWLEKATTENGNTIDYFRVDTVKHVEDTTLMHFKNELTKADPAFKLIGEAFGAGPNNEYANRYLNTGTMDSLLDFDFKNIAHRFVDGEIASVNTDIEERTNRLDSSATMGQFLGSHDEPGFLHFIDDQNPNKLKIAATLQIMSKGQPVIYYGEELGLSGEDNWPEYDNRYVFPWDKVEGNDVHNHYQKLLNIRGDHSKLLSKGSYDYLAGDDDSGYLVFERKHDGKSATIGINTTDKAQNVTFTSPFEANTTADDVYNDTSVEVDHDKDVTVHLPGKNNGGTFILVADESNEGDIAPIPEDTLRVHYKREDQQFNDLGLWTWEDVVTPSEDFPAGSTPFNEDRQTDYGAYIDIPLKKDAQKIGLLVVDRETGDKDGDDKLIELFSKDINEVWIEEDSDTVSLVEPIDLPKDTVRIHYEQSGDDGSDDLGLWTWDDVQSPSDEWPNDALNPTGIGAHGAYYDLKLAENPEAFSFLFVNKEHDDEQSMNYTYADFDHNQLFIHEGDENIYTHPYGTIPTQLLSGDILSDEKIQLTFSKTDELTAEQLEQDIGLVDRDEQTMIIDDIKIVDDTLVELYGNFNLDAAPFYVTYDEQTLTIEGSWRMIDEMFAYDGDLGTDLHEDGTATLKIWSPKADDLSVVLYDAEDQSKVIKENIPMEKNEQGVWEVTLDSRNTGLNNLRGFYYHYNITHGDETELALDPYAKSMAGWANPESGGEYPVGKAAIVDPETIGPELDFATIDGFDKREDAIIYEAHVRDFTSDPSLSDELDAPFGTFSAFVEKLDYIEGLGVTHIQLLPVMSYYFGNEWESNEHLLDWSSSGNNYNWGYDPHSYFSLTGMYSENPDDPEQRIEAFKRLIAEIHSRDMGVVLDVVFNHTAQVDLFEDLVPNYYHFMDADGTPRESFGGGRLGTTHEMTRKLLVDSLTYWIDEFKVDGFRFDMMGDHDTETMQRAYDEAKKINPNIIMIGEGWITYEGDEGDSVIPADQHWMQDTESVGVFSDEFRNELKSGFGSEGEPRFLTGGARSIQQIFDNMTAQPHNFVATNPGDVVQYIAAHDNLTLHDVIAQSIKKDPEHHQEEIHKRIRIGNAMVLMSQGTAFLHAGQEFGRTKQFRDEAEKAPYKSTYMTDDNGDPFEYPYFIHDSYDSTDVINQIDWDMATDEKAYPIHNQTRDYTTGLIELRRSTDAFSLATMEEIDEHVSLIDAPEISEEDLMIGFETMSSDQSESYAVFINADDTKRTLTLDDINLKEGDVIVDGQQSGTDKINEPVGVQLAEDKITIEPLTTVVVKLAQDSEEPEKPEDPEEPIEPEKPVDPSEGDNSGEANDDTNENGSGNKDSDTEQSGDSEGENGEKLPKTATNLYNWLLIGILLFVVGLFIIRRSRKQLQ